MKFSKSFKVELELTSKCVLLCPNCPRTYQAHMRRVWDNGHVDHEKLLEFLKTSEYKRFQLGGAYGDGLYHPHLVTTLKAIKEAGASFNFDTNGSRRPEADWKELAKMMTWKDCVIFSIDGTPDNFTQYRVNADWESIEMGARIIAQGGGRARWKYIVFKYNQTFEDMKTAYDKAYEMGMQEFVIVHTHRAEKGQLANKADFDDNLVKLEEYVWNMEHLNKPKLSVAVTPRTSVFKSKSIIENTEKNAHVKMETDKVVKKFAQANDVKTEELGKTNINVNRKFQRIPQLKKELVHTEKVSPQCINIEGHSNFISSEGLFLPCCYMRVGQQEHFDHAGITKEDEKSLSIYNNTYDEIIEGVAIKKIMSNFDKVELCARRCGLAKTKG